MSKPSINNVQNSPSKQRTLNEHRPDDKKPVNTSNTRFGRLMLSKKRVPAAKTKNLTGKFSLKTPINNAPKKSGLAQKIDNSTEEELKLDQITAHSANASVASQNLEENIGVICQGSGDSFSQSELRALIRKISLSFKVKADEADFLIKDGLFKGAHFGIKRDGQDILIEVANASSLAEQILNDNTDQLRKTLSNREIKLADIRFMS